MAKVLSDFSRLGSGRAVVATVPAGITVEVLSALFGTADFNQRGQEERQTSGL
jgi:hypothetical protein